uniref:Uncharacterized protein n=1 Tax=Arundo donax TaxID=35708 RepID=A0A0A8Z1B6_ARUDO
MYFILVLLLHCLFPFMLVVCLPSIVQSNNSSVRDSLMFQYAAS